jgi:hypothetical protein
MTDGRTGSGEAGEELEEHMEVTRNRSVKRCPCALAVLLSRGCCFQVFYGLYECRKWGVTEVNSMWPICILGCLLKERRWRVSPTQVFNKY